jgi:hypothetical protein
MPEFVATGTGSARLLLDDTETHVIRQLASELRTLLDAGRIDRGDPVYERLFPSAYEDVSDETAYRDLVGDDLVTFKLDALEKITNDLGEGARGSDIALVGDTLDLWLACLTDLRLAIGTRLDVDEERMGAEVDPNDPDARSLAVLHWLGWIQEGVIRAASEL